MRLSTKVTIEKPPFQLAVNSCPSFLGSCFAIVIGGRWRQAGLPACLNPFGALFNPASLLQAMQLLENPAGDWLESALFSARGLWHSWFFHSDFSDLVAKRALEKMRCSFRAGRFAWQQQDLVFLTWGTAWAWYHQSAPQQVVSNCHRLPNKEFNCQLLTVPGIVSGYSDFLEKVLLAHPSLRFVFSISPVRHWGQGGFNNSISKATLFLALHQLSARFPDKISYFPAYEILLDELRDYRFYADDLCHPGNNAEEIIWGRFLDNYCESELFQYISEKQKLLQQQKHRPRFPDSPETKAWQQKLDRQERDLQNWLKSKLSEYEKIPP